MTGKIAVGGITRKDGLVLIRVKGAQGGPGVAGRALSALGLRGINLTCVTSSVDSQGLTNIFFAICAGDLDQCLGILQSLEEEINPLGIDYQRGCSAISVYGPHFSERPSIAGTIFDTIAETDVEIHMICTSFSTVSFLANEEQALAAVTALHENFLVP